MSKITLTEAVNLLPVSESTLRRDMLKGKVSADKDLRGRNVFDVAELQRVYGDLNLNSVTPLSDDSANDRVMTGDDTPMIERLEGQVQDLKALLDQGTHRKLATPRTCHPSTETE